MFPIPWNFPFRKKDGTVVNVEDAIDAGTGIPEHDEGDAGKVLSVDESGNLEWSDELTPITATITPASGITLARNSIIKQGKLAHIFFKIESPAPDTTSTDVVIGVTPFLPENDFVFMPCYDIDRPFEIKHSAFIRKSTGEIVFPAGSTAVPVYVEGVYACQ